MIANFGPWHWLVLAVVVVVLFGAKKLQMPRSRSASRCASSNPRFVSCTGSPTQTPQLHLCNLASHRPGSDSAAAERNSTDGPVIGTFTLLREST